MVLNVSSHQNQPTNQNKELIPQNNYYQNQNSQATTKPGLEDMLAQFLTTQTLAMQIQKQTMQHLETRLNLLESVQEMG